jgi:hypothetical protein
MSPRSILNSGRAAGKIGAGFLTRYKLLIIFILIMIPLTVGYGDEEEASITVVNKTEHFLHIIVDGDPYLYVTPDMGITHSTSPKGEFSVTALYSPGQGITGKIYRTVPVSYQAASSGCGYSSSGGCECVTNPPSAGSTLYEITADTMLVETIITN